MAAGEEDADNMVAENIADLSAKIADRERRGRISHGMRTGKPISSADVREGENFRMTQCEVTMRVAQARQLTTSERSFIDIVRIFTFETGSYARTGMYESEPPTLTDWCNWLGGWSKSQVINVRTSLHAKGLIRFEEDDPRKVIFVWVWEEWDPAVFGAHAPKRGNARTSANRSLSNERGKEKSASFITNATQRSLSSEQSGARAFIRQLTPDATDAGNDADSGDLTIFPKPEEIYISSPTNVGGAPQAAAPSRHRRKTTKSGSEEPADRATTIYGPPKGWTEIAPGEREREYYIRAVGLCSNKIAALAYVASQKLGLPNNSVTIDGIKAAKARLKANFGRYGEAYCREGIVLIGILNAAAADSIDDDKIKYLIKCAESVAQKQLDRNQGRTSAGGARTYGRQQTRAESRRRIASNVSDAERETSVLVQHDDE